MEDNLKPGLGEGPAGVEPRDQVPQVSCGVDNWKNRTAEEEDGTRSDQWGVYSTMK